MICESVEKEARELIYLGDLRGAERTLIEFLSQVPVETWFTRNGRAYLMLGSTRRTLGMYPEAQQIFLELIGAGPAGRYVRANAVIEMAACHDHLHEYGKSARCLEDVGKIIDLSLAPGLDVAHDKTMVHYYNIRSLVEYRAGRPRDAVASLEEALKHVDAVNRTEEFMRPYVLIYQNMYNNYMLMGDTEQAEEFLFMAHDRINSLKSPYAQGLVHLFENLVTYNLFALGSQNKAIDALTNLSEQVVKNFADFHKARDFFSSIIVQLHEEKVDMDQIREQLEGYGDDPLIKAYLPVLLASAPLPGGEKVGESM